ncbi:MAG: SDR family oxidoreductase, partial [Longimicrobiales bacterium]
MKLLVTGAGGLLGSAVVRSARGRGHEVMEGVRAPGENELTAGIGPAADTTAGIGPAAETAAGIGPAAETGSRILVDVTDREHVAEVVSEVAPDAVVHCAGYTDVDGAEANRDEAFEVNVSGSRWVARAAADAGSLVLLPSTDYVFDGTASRPYRPGDSPNPINL